MHGSHVKGKLREAFEGLRETELIDDQEIDRLLGKESDSRPHRGKLNFSDFRPKIPDIHYNTLTRVKMDTQTGTAKENALVTIEHLNRPASLSVWTGTLSFVTDGEDAEGIRETVLRGLKWITNFGAIKGNGHGRLERVTVELQKDTTLPVVHLPDVQTSVLTLQFEFHDPVFIGGIARGSNFKASQEIIPGAVLKGAFARFLNELCGADDTAEITMENTSVKNTFPHLTRHFSRIRFSHAFPVHVTAQRRPVAIPFSTVQDAEEHLWDLALHKALREDRSLQENRTDAHTDAVVCTFRDKDENETAPVYQIDWKNMSAIKPYFGWGTCQTVNTTRTAIEDATRTAEEEKLYTFQYISPDAPDRRKNRWIATLRLPVPPDMSEIEANLLHHEFQKALQAGWRYLGKRDARFRLSIFPGDFGYHIASPFGPLVNNMAIVVLQTDVLLFDCRSAAGQRDPDPARLYREYWQAATDDTCQLVTYFARQKMEGGYLVRRYEPPDKPYYPYILTEAGSVFVLRTQACSNRYLVRLSAKVKLNSGMPGCLIKWKHLAC